MAARGYFPSTFEGRDVQHGSLLLEHKFASQAAEIEGLTKDNQRFATAHVALRGELVAAQQELQRLRAHIRSIQTESDIQIRILLDKISRMEADVLARENVKKELKQAHMEANGLAKAREELTNQIQRASQELQKVQAEAKILPDLLVELNKLRLDHKRLRITFDYEKGLNIAKVEQLKGMEQKLIGMAREVEKLNAEVLNVEKRASAPNPYGGGYPNPLAPYPVAHGGGSYVDAYRRPLVQMGFAPAANGVIPYGDNGVVTNNMIADVPVTNAGSGSSWGAPSDPSLAQRSFVRMPTSKSIVTELKENDKLKGDNYNIWVGKVLNALEEQNACGALDAVLNIPKNDNTSQNRQDCEAYDAWKKKNTIARIVILSAIADDIAEQFGHHEYARDLWNALKEKFGGVSLAKLRSLTIKFDSYEKKSNHSMKDHLREMTNMMSELSDGGHNLTEGQKIEAVIRSLPISWEYMKLRLRHASNITTFNDVVHSLEHEEDHLASLKTIWLP